MSPLRCSIRLSHALNVSMTKRAKKRLALLQEAGLTLPRSQWQVLIARC